MGDPSQTESRFPINTVELLLNPTRGLTKLRVRSFGTIPEWEYSE